MTRPKGAAANRAKITATTMQIPAARLGPPNPLPKFAWQQPVLGKPIPPHRGLSPEETELSFLHGKDSILPYQVFDDYDRSQTPTILPIVTLDNGHLRVTIAPGFGGRVTSLRDLRLDRELLFANPVFQPGNLGLLNAWWPGGIEWNGVVPGHTPVACTPVFVATLETERGPVLRIYEFDRVMQAAWQIDLFVPDGDDRLFMHGRIINPDPTDMLGFWWTNTAVAMTPGLRVLSPADYGVEHVLPGNELARLPFPDPERFDGSYPDNWRNATSVFFRAPHAPRLWIAALDKGGVGLVQTATERMRGRKFFYFGNAPGGKHWMDFLSQPGKGDYIEIQSGFMPTQNQRFAFPGNSEIHWTECYAALEVDAKQTHSAEYQKAVAAAGLVIDQRIPVAELDEIDVFLREVASRPAERRLSAGSPWGGRDERLMARPIAAGLDFSTPEAGRSAWDDLADDGKFSPAALDRVPSDFAVSARWTTALAKSADAHGETWLHALMLGLAALNEGRHTDAADLSSRSLKMKPTWLGYRQRALVAASPDAAEQDYLLAWSMPGAPPDLADEIVDFFRKTGRFQQMSRFLDNLAPAVLGRERVVLARAQVAAQSGQVKELEAFLTTEFATIREGETLLDELWLALHRNTARRALGREPTGAELADQMTQNPIPWHLNFQMLTDHPVPLDDTSLN